MQPLSKFRNRSLLVALSGGVKELRVFPAILHLSGNSTPVERARSSDATSPELSHGTCIHRCAAELMALTARGQPEIRQIGRALRRSPPQLARTWTDFWLLSWRCTLGALFECGCHRELSQIQASPLKSLKFSILQIRPGPFLNVT